MASNPSGIGIPPILGYILTNMTRVAVGVLQKGGKVLVCQRKKGSRYGLKWEFPGGKLEPGETILECLKRELFEELSISVRDIDRVQIQSTFYEDGGMFEVAYCFVSQFTGEARNNAFEEIRWVTIPELRALDNLKGNEAFVASLTSS
jgi:8-oxo-dGTP diphosphatase